jgi:GxxExxY protein
MALEFDAIGLGFAREVPLNVFYMGEVVGKYFVDFVVEGVIVELKAVWGLCGAEERQVLNYLKAGGFEIGLILNFGVKAQVRRKIRNR